MVVAVVALAVGSVLLGFALSGVFDQHSSAAAEAAPPVAPQVVVVTPAPASAAPAATSSAPAPVAQAPAPSATQKTVDERRFTTNDQAHVPASWVSGFYEIYAQAQKTYGVNWLLIASVHKQETAFSTHPTTYHGLNFANCCAGPMQFNVKNSAGGSLSTWARYKNAGAQAPRPSNYPHKTAKHPSVYDDYDAIMAAAALLRDSGAGRRLDASAWRAAYDYYGHDLTGVDYANEVLARAIGWGQHAFCINCTTDASLQNAVDAAWGAPVRAEMTAPPAAEDDATALAASKKNTKKRQR
ncbi:hypothetical protein DSM104299_00553 [Baekduia alba]|uniref:hypothetical protein n=1 Tax=Baekduia alba TaxID=2997333 RepID=UPI00234130D3|nr:hypothetical protein [Baekduia alba]WCB91875.1 hypothetical protein DSM104299_00553 [Baekduia alba]